MKAGKKSIMRLNEADRIYQFIKKIALFLLVASIGVLYPAVGMTRDILYPGPGLASIQDAIDAAQDGDTVLIAAGSYRENGITIQDKSILVTGTGPSSTIIDGGGASGVPVFDVWNQLNEGFPGFEISGMTIQGGEPGVRVNGEWAQAMFSNCTFQLNRTGVMIMAFSSFSHISDCTFIGNTGHRVMSDLFSIGGGVIFYPETPYHCQYFNPECTDDDRSPGLLLIDGCTFLLNAASVGGAIFTGGPTEVRGCQIVNNFAEVSGQNDSGIGGGILVEGSNNGFLMLSNSTVKGNMADVAGGGIAAWGADIWVGSSTLSGNIALGAGIANNDFIPGAGEFGAFGGGLYLLDSTARMENCVVAANRAGRNGSGVGGGIYCDMSAVFGAIEGTLLDMVHCTVSRNQAGRGGGLAMGPAVNEHDELLPRSFVQNSIIWGNTDQAPGRDQDIALLDPAFPLAMKFSDVDTDLVGARMINRDPLFVGNGNYALRQGSPCIDAAPYMGVRTDVRGVARPQGRAYDMGAYEYVAR